MDLLQWPGMALGLAGGPLVASTLARRRHLGFGLWLGSNACWIAWGTHAGAWGLVGMQVAFCLSSWLGWRNTREPRPLTYNSTTIHVPSSTAGAEG